MKFLLAMAWIVALLFSGCASSPTSSTAESGETPKSEESITKLSAPGKDVLILRQTGGVKDQSDRKQPGGPEGKQQDSTANAEICPPGQLMAIRVITGETGTRTTEECVTPFSAMGRKYQRKRPVAIKVRNVGGSLQAEEVLKK